MKLFCLTVIKDHEDPEKAYTIAENETEARENIFKAAMAYENSYMTEGDEPHTKESIEDLYRIEDIDQIPDEIDGYKISLTKI